MIDFFFLDVFVLSFLLSLKRLCPQPVRGVLILTQAGGGGAPAIRMWVFALFGVSSPVVGLGKWTAPALA